MAEGVIKRREPLIRPAPYALLILLPAAEVEAAFLSLPFIVSGSEKCAGLFCTVTPYVHTMCSTDKAGV